MAMDAFDLAERQTPVFLTDLDLGLNNWMAGPLPTQTGRRPRRVLRIRPSSAPIAKFRSSPA